MAEQPKLTSEQHYYAGLAREAYGNWRNGDRSEIGFLNQAEGILKENKLPVGVLDPSKSPSQVQREFADAKQYAAELAAQGQLNHLGGNVVQSAVRSLSAHLGDCSQTQSIGEDLRKQGVNLDANRDGKYAMGELQSGLQSGVARFEKEFGGKGR